MDAVPVKIPCPCPGKPHADGDTVGLRPKLDLVRGMLVQSVVSAAKRKAEEDKSEIDMAMTTALITEAYLLQGVFEWTLVDQLGASLPVTPETIRSQLLDDFTIASDIADRADDLYMEAVIRPLLAQASTSSQHTSTNESTSRSTKRTQKRPKRSRQSSTSTTPTAATETTTPSPDGASSSSRSETLAAG